MTLVLLRKNVRSLGTGAVVLGVSTSHSGRRTISPVWIAIFLNVECPPSLVRLSPKRPTIDDPRLPSGYPKSLLLRNLTRAPRRSFCPHHQVWMRHPTSCSSCRPILCNTPFSANTPCTCPASAISLPKWPRLDQVWNARSIQSCTCRSRVRFL